MGFNNAEPISLDDAVERLKDKCPGLLLQDERVDMGFKAIRDRYYFTSHRVLIEDKQGITGKRIEYKDLFHNTFSSGFPLIRYHG